MLNLLIGIKAINCLYILINIKDRRFNYYNHVIKFT
jgi:hypothetical protein